MPYNQFAITRFSNSKKINYSPKDEIQNACMYGNIIVCVCYHRMEVIVYGPYY